MPKLIQKIIVLVLLLLLAAACAAPATQPAPAAATAADTTAVVAPIGFPLTITDAVGQEFTFDAPPKIGCDWLGCQEILTDLGVVPQASYWGGRPSTFLTPLGQPPYIVSDWMNPEQWAAAEIDLLIKRGPANPNDDALAAMVPIFRTYFPPGGTTGPTGIDAYYENARLLGQLTGKPNEAEAIIDRFEAVQEKLRTLATDATRALRIAPIFGDPAAYYALGNDNPFCTVIADTGLGQCMEAGWWEEVNAEAFLGYDPDWIIYMDQNWPALVDAEAADVADRTDPIWPELTAVKEGRVYKAATQRFDCCSTRILTHALQDYVSHVLPEAGIPAPVAINDFDPQQSPLLATTIAATSQRAGNTYTDAFGRQVELPTSPQRIVAHYFAADMVALGLPMIGTNYVNAEIVLTPEQLAGLTDTGTGDPNLETILSLQPDLIFVPDFTDAAVVDLLAEIAPTIVIPYGGDPFDRLRLFGELTGKPEAADAWIDAYHAKAAAKRAEVAPLMEAGESATAFIMYGDGQFYIYGRPRLGPTLYDVFGFTQPAAVTELFKDDPTALWQTLSVELLPDYVGDRIFLVLANGEDTEKATAALIEGPIWQSLPAVQNGKVYYVATRWALNDPLTLDWLLDEVAAVLMTSE